MRNRAIRGCLIFAISFGVCAGLEAKPQQLKQAPQVETEKPSSDALERRKDTNKKQEEAAPPTPRAEHVLPESQNRERDRHLDQPKEDASEFIEVVGIRLKAGEFLLIIFTAGLFLATLALWLATRRLVRDAKDASERQLRAYVHITTVEIRRLEGTAQFFIEYRNSGQTPAYELAGWNVIEYRPCPSDLSFPNDWKRGALGVLGPGGTAHFVKEGPRQLTVPELDSLKTGSGAIYFYGEFTYRDAFGKLRTTCYRHMIGGQAGINEYRLMGACQEGNEAD